MAEYIKALGEECWLLERFTFGESASGHFKIINLSCSVSVFCNQSADCTLDFCVDLHVGREVVIHNKRNILDYVTILFLMIKLIS